MFEAANNISLSSLSENANSDVSLIYGSTSDALGSISAQYINHCNWARIFRPRYELAVKHKEVYSEVNRNLAPGS